MPVEPEIELPNSKFEEGPGADQSPNREHEEQYDPDNFSSGDDSPVMGGYPAQKDSSSTSLFDMEAGNFDDYNAMHE